VNIRHIHEVVFLIEQYNKELTPEKLVEKIGDTWGTDVRFAACSGTAFPKEYAVDFLLYRQKAIITETGVVALHPSMQLCNGHEEFEVAKSIV